MIPRPQSDDAARYNPGRWICNTHPERCNGIFRVYGQDMVCPIRAKCFFGRQNTYEWTPGRKVSGRYPALDIDAGRRKWWCALNKFYQRVWGGKKAKPKTPEQKARHAAAMRERRAKERPLDKPVALPPRDLLPCGEDCDSGCPYGGPDGCPYGDLDEDALAVQAKREKERRKRREKSEKMKARAAVDPPYAAHLKELSRQRNHRHYWKDPEASRAKARERQKMKRKGAVTK